MTATFGEVLEGLRRSTVSLKAQSGSGSGVIWSRDGRIVTNAHVVEGVDGVEVELWDGRLLRGEVVQRNRRRDLAALHVSAQGLCAATPGDSTAIRAGELVIAVGNPWGFIGAASTGVVHQVKHRSWLISSVRLAPGNSGGPLANVRGQVVGINTMVAGGLAFAIPSSLVARFLGNSPDEQYGLGVVVRPVALGLIVLEIVPNSPADRASLLQGDILVGARGKPFASPDDLAVAIEETRGGILELQFRRGASPAIRIVPVLMAAAAARAA